MTYPIPEAALDDRLACVGTSGSGKTYAMGTAVEKLLHRGARVVVADPLGVWWGLRLREDGTASRFGVVIFGGPHADLPLTEHSGALIGEAAATMAESCILDLSELGTKAAERRFMLAFLTALYRKATGEPVHLVLDEADMWAPQQLRDKEGEAAKLLGMMETVVRRGRIKGFIPWLITQRPAVLNKDVLSQVDGVIAMKLTATQDRNALDGWIEGSADLAEAKRIKGEMPGLQLGEAIVWLPGRGVLTQARFPKKVTFDSSRTPKRGEAKRTHTLKPLDVESLKGKLATVEAEVAASDPKKLKARIADLERERSNAIAEVTPSAQLLREAQLRGDAEGFERGRASGKREGLVLGLRLSAEAVQRAAADAEVHLPKEVMKLPAAPPPVAKPVATATRPPSNGSAKAMAGAEARILGALELWESVGIAAPTRQQVAFVAACHPRSKGFVNALGGLRSAGHIDYSGSDGVILQPGAPAVGGADPERFLQRLSGPQRAIVSLLASGTGKLDRELVAEKLGYHPRTKGFVNNLGALRGAGILDYEQGNVVLADWVHSLPVSS